MQILRRMPSFWNVVALLLSTFMLPTLMGCGDSSDRTVETPISTTETVQLTVVHEENGQGLINPPPGVHEVQKDAPVDILAVPDSGHVFFQWVLSGNGEVTAPDSPDTKVTLTGDGVLKPEFKPAVNVIFHVSPPSVGFTAPVAEDTVTIGKGDTLQLSATAGTGYHFSTWRSEDGCHIEDALSADTVATVTSDCEITAEFELDVVQFSGIVNANAYTSTNGETRNVRTIARLLWLGAVSPFASSPDEFTYHVYRSREGEVEQVYQQANLVSSLEGEFQTEVEIDPKWDKTYFLVVAEDPRGNSNVNHKVVHVTPGDLEFYDGAPPINLSDVGADEITVSEDENIVTLHGGDWRYLFPSYRDIIVNEAGPYFLKEVRSVTFDGRNTMISYVNVNFDDIVKSGHFSTWTAFPDISQLPAQTRQGALNNPHTPDDFLQPFESLDQDDADIYINPLGNVMVWESHDPDVVPSRDNRFEKEIAITDKATGRRFGTLYFLVDLSLAAGTVLKEDDGVVHRFEVNVTGTARIEAIAKIEIDSDFDHEWRREGLLKKGIKLVYTFGPIPVYQELEFWVDSDLFVDIKDGSLIQATAGVKLNKRIDIGLVYEPVKKWSTYYIEDSDYDIPFEMKGSAATDTTLHIRPHIKTSFNKSAHAEITIKSINKLFADFFFDDSIPYLTRCDFKPHAYMVMECDFVPFGQLLFTKSDSLWLYDTQIYSLPETQFHEWLPNTVYIGEEPYLLEDVVYYDFIDGINNPRRNISWVLEKIEPDGQGWVTVPGHLKPGLPLINLSAEPPPYLYEYNQTADLLVDKRLGIGLYRIRLTGETNGWLGPLDTRKSEARFMVQMEE